MTDPKPLADITVGDRFWLAYAQELVRGAVSAPERRAEQLSAAIAWLWTIYSSAALVVLAVGGARLPILASLLIALPSVLLIVAYWLASRVRRAIAVEFDPRVPAQVEFAHAQAAQVKARSLRFAEAAAAIAACSVVLSLLTALLGKGGPEAELAVRADPADPRQLLVLGSMPKHAAVQLSVRDTAASAAAGGTVSSLERADDQGLLRARLRAAGDGPQRVTATWTDGQLERSVSTLVKRGD